MFQKKFNRNLMLDVCEFDSHAYYLSFIHSFLFIFSSPVCVCVSFNSHYEFKFIHQTYRWYERCEYMIEIIQETNHKMLVTVIMVIDNDNNIFQFFIHQFLIYLFHPVLYIRYQYYFLVDTQINIDQMYLTHWSIHPFIHSFPWWCNICFFLFFSHLGNYYYCFK